MTGESVDEDLLARQSNLRFMLARGNKNANNDRRKIEIGWMEYDSVIDEFKQVRAKHGGGTRKVTIAKTARKEDILSTAKTLFFPMGSSPRSDAEHYTFDVKDFQENTIDDNLTVGDLYAETKLPLLRFYLLTKLKSPDAQ